MTLKVWGEFCLFLVGSSGVTLVSALILVYFFFLSIEFDNVYTDFSSFICCYLCGKIPRESIKLS